MDALLLALLLTLTLDQGSGTQHLVARTGDRAPLNAVTIGGLAFVTAINAVVAAALGSMMATLLMPDARLLFLAIALLIGGVGHLIAPFRTPPLPVATPFRSRLRTLSTYAVRRAGENAAFATAGVAAFTDAPVLAAIGATLGGWVALIPALAIGSRYARHGLMRVFQILSGSILLCIAIACAVNALRII